MGKRIRKLFTDNIDPLNSVVELDETYYGAKESNKHQHKRTLNKHCKSTKTLTTPFKRIKTGVLKINYTA